MKYTTCPDCNKEISNSNIKNHMGSKQCLKNQTKTNHVKQLLPNGKYQCPYCEKQYGFNGIGTHIWRNHGDGQGWTANNDGYKTGERVGTNVYAKNPGFKMTEETKQKISKKKLGNNHTIETKKIMSEKRKKMFIDGKISGWNRVYSYTQNPELGDKPASLYIGLFEYEDIKFIKIGITINSFKFRYKHKQYDKFKKTLLFSKQSTNLEAAILENDLLNELKGDYNFMFPFDRIEKFDGYSECLSIDAIEVLMMKLNYNHEY
jgi:hypothetical protein